MKQETGQERLRWMVSCPVSSTSVSWAVYRPEYRNSTLTRSDRLEGFEEPRNFTTFPDGRMTRHFRFVHAGQPTPASRSFFIPRDIQFKQWSQSRRRLAGWHSLEEWVSDLRKRSAWVPASFALIGERISKDQSRCAIPERQESTSKGVGEDIQRKRPY